MEHTARRFGLDLKNPTHKKLVRGLHAWWRTGMKVGDAVWVVDQGRHGEPILWGKIEKLGARAAHLTLDPPLTIWGGAATLYDRPHLLPSYAWALAQHHYHPYRDALDALCKKK